MEINKYSSYSEIDRELEILKLEKEVHLQKLLLGIEKTKEDFSTQNIIKEVLGYSKAALTNSYVKILQAVIPYLINWIINRKRGD